MNSVTLIGNIATEIKLNHTQSGKSVINFNIAVKKNFSDGTDFFTVVAWNKTAELIKEYFVKGDKIGITGELSSRNYEDSNGNKRTAIEVIASNFDFCTSKKDKSEQSSSATESASTTPITDDSDLPW